LLNLYVAVSEINSRAQSISMFVDDSRSAFVVCVTKGTWMRQPRADIYSVECAKYSVKRLPSPMSPTKPAGVIIRSV